MKMFFRSDKWPVALAYTVLIVLLTISLGGCVAGFKGLRSSAEKKPVKEKDDPAPIAEPAAARVDPEGSLWRENSPFAQMFEDQKARQVGDIVTIKIKESSSASNNASTETERDSNLLGKINTFFGVERRWTDSTYPGFDPDRLFNPFSSVEGNMKSDFTGAGKTTRSGDLTAYITARVTEVMPAGNLKIKGSREVEVNNEKQVITLTGVIRTADISPDNVILSTYISDAKISYSGLGIIHDRQRPGWMSNILNKIWPF